MAFARPCHPLYSPALCKSFADGFSGQSFLSA
jgi:hypothetical protein